jgi:hypothetical protein
MGGQMGESAKELWVSFGSDENVLKLIVVMGKHFMNMLNTMDIYILIACIV